MHMKKLLITGFLAALLFVSMDMLPARSYGMSGCEEDCMKCHSMSKQDVKQILNKLGAPEAEPLEIKTSPLKGLWEVIIDDRGKGGILYVGFSKRHVIAGPIFEVDTGLNKTEEAFGRVNRNLIRYVDFAKISLDNALVMGRKDAKHKVVVFTDPDCPFCGKIHEELKKVLAETDEIAFYLKLMPLAMHPEAFWKSQSILCRNSIELLEDNFAKKDIPRPECDKKDEVESNLRLAAELGITGTPTLIFPDGMVLVGGKDAKTLKDLALNPPKKEDKK